MKLNSTMYDILKEFALVWLPALATLFFTLAQIWNIPYAEQIVGTMTAVDAFLGAILKVSSDKFYKELIKGSD